MRCAAFVLLAGCTQTSASAPQPLPLQRAEAPTCTPRTQSRDYPARYPKCTRAELGAMRAELARSFADVTLDDYGFAQVVRARPIDRLPNAIDLTFAAPWIARVKESSAVFAIDGAASFSQVASYVAADQTIDGQPIARITIESYASSVQISGHHWPGVVTPPATVDAAWIASRLVGATYDAKETFGPPPCAYGSPCKEPPPVWSLVHVTREMIRSSEAIRVVKRAEGAPLEVRRVARVALAPTPSGGDVVYTPRGDAPPIPWVIDMVTGEDLRTTKWCRGSGWNCSDWTWCKTDCGPL